MNSNLPTIKVTSFSGAVDMCAAWHPRAVVSALDPSQAKKTAKMADNHLILDFCDQEIGDYSHPPQPEHIQKFLKFTRSFEWRKGELFIIHCHAGLCRSPALAIGFVVDYLTRNRVCGNLNAVREAFTTIQKIRPQMWPNLRVITLLDEAIGVDGLLIDATHEYRSQNMGLGFSL